MFDNKVINELYDKINTLNKLKAEHDDIKSMCYAVTLIVLLSLMLATIKFLGSSVISMFLIAIQTIALMTVFHLFLNFRFYDPISRFWYKPEKDLETKKQELIQYLSKESTQLELFTFTFNSVNEESVTDLKKYLSLKDYSKAFKCIIEIINIEYDFKQNEISEAETKKLIEEHELSLKMKL